MMPEFDPFDIVGRGTLALSNGQHLVGWHKQELRIRVDELLDQPGTGDPVDLHTLTGDPFHRGLLSSLARDMDRNPLANCRRLRVHQRPTIATESAQRWISCSASSTDTTECVR